ncbi:hypothetical protein AVEN_81909-1 [Araneus ventricosus]|uniref:Uncharacterized protein n=1 Tax=Araneus ventricosus TaxID=182803 RepID=A0A4Y2VJN8_ARAVE|nr:hypothetical protein AVEN_81909-1 [Araneus ventricosus]
MTSKGVKRIKPCGISQIFLYPCRYLPFEHYRKQLAIVEVNPRKEYIAFLHYEKTTSSLFITELLAWAKPLTPDTDLVITLTHRFETTRGKFFVTYLERQKSPGAKVSASGPENSNAIRDPLCMRARALNLKSRVKRHPLLWHRCLKRGRVQMSFSSSGHDSKLQGAFQNSPCVASKHDVKIIELN